MTVPSVIQTLVGRDCHSNNHTFRELAVNPIIYTRSGSKGGAYTGNTLFGRQSINQRVAVVLFPNCNNSDRGWDHFSREVIPTSRRTDWRSVFRTPPPRNLYLPTVHTLLGKTLCSVFYLLRRLNDHVTKLLWNYHRY